MSLITIYPYTPARINRLMGILPASLALLLAISQFSFAAPAQMQQRVQGQARVEVKSRRQYDSALQAGVQLAKFNAIENYVSADQNKDRIFTSCLRDKALQDPDYYISSYVIKDESMEGKNLRVIIEIALRSARLDNDFLSCKPTVEYARKGKIAFVFVVREAIGDDQFRTPRFFTSPGAVIEAVLTNNQFVGVSMATSVSMRTAGYSLDDLSASYARGETIDRTVVERAARATDNDYLAFGEFHIDEVSYDPIRELYRANVVVNFDLTILDNLRRAEGPSNRKPVVAPASHSAFGQTREAAIRDAASLAAREVAETMVAVLNSLSI